MHFPREISRRMGWIRLFLGILRQCSSGKRTNYQKGVWSPELFLISGP
jgi:hypothetical protein